LYYKCRRKSLRVLFPFVGDSVGGSHISTLELYSSLVDKGIHVFILIHECDGPLSQYLHNKKIPFSIMKVSRLAGEYPGILPIAISILTNFFRFSRFIKMHKIDIVHGNDLRINLSWSLPAKIFSKGFVWHQRTLLSSSKIWVLIQFLCSYFIAISDVVMQSAPKGISVYKKKTVYNPFNVNLTIDKKLARECTAKEYGIQHGSFLLGYVGRIVDYKNVDFILKSLSNIRYKDVHLLIVGSGEEDYINELKLYADTLGIKDRVTFTGFVDNPSAVITSLDVLIASSQIDAFGRTIVEAMLQKTPVIAAKSGGHIDIIQDGINGLFYNVEVVNDLSEKISFIYNNARFRGEVVSEAYLFAKNKFSSDSHLSKIMHIYDLVNEN